jgi:hypothetical protein
MLELAVGGSTYLYPTRNWLLAQAVFGSEVHRGCFWGGKVHRVVCLQLHILSHSPCGTWLFIPPWWLGVRFWVCMIGADKMPRCACYSPASWLILSGITMHMLSGSFVVEEGCFIWNVSRFLLAGVRQLVSLQVSWGMGPCFINCPIWHHFKTRNILVVFIIPLGLQIIFRVPPFSLVTRLYGLCENFLFEDVLHSGTRRQKHPLNWTYVRCIVRRKSSSASAARET